MRFLLVLLPFLLLGQCGCVGARVVRETPDGGVVSVPLNTNCWPMYYRSQAEKLMRDKCPSGFRIEREEYVFNGKPGVQGHRAHDSYFGYTDPDDEMAPYLRKEYWIAFQAASPGSQQTAANALPNPDTSPLSLPSGSPARGEDKEELPAPRPLKEAQE